MHDVCKHAHKKICGIMHEKGQCMGEEKRKQQVMDKLFKSLAEQSVESPVLVQSQVPKKWI